jgi:hypothetical protein
MEQNSKSCEAMELDISDYLNVIVKRKKTLFFVVLLTLAISVGVVLMQSSLKIYRVSMMMQPPVIGPSFTGANDLESAENLKALIVSGAFNDELQKTLNLGPNVVNLEFEVVIPNKTNILQVGINLEGKKKEFGIELLQGLSNAISNKFAKNIEANIADISSQIKFNERGIVDAKEKANSLQLQIKEILVREDKLLEELKAVNLTTAQIWEKRDLYLKESTSSGNSLALFMASFLQNNSSYLNQLNNQFSELAIRRNNLNLELKNITSQISNFQIEIDRFNRSKDFIANLKIVAQPRVSSNPINQSKKKILGLSIALGLFCGVFAVFLQEFWVSIRNPKKT